MKLFGRARAFALFAILVLVALLMLFVPLAPAQAQSANHVMLSAATGTGPSAIPGPGNYVLNLTADSFGGATVALIATDPLTGKTFTKGSWTSAPTTQPCIVVGQGERLQMTVTGGSLTNGNAILRGAGSVGCGVASTGGSGSSDAQDSSIKETHADAGSDASKAEAIQGLTGGKPVAVKEANGDNATLGAQADTACGSDAGTCTTQALIKRLNAAITTLNGKIDTLNTNVTSPVPAGTALIGGESIYANVGGTQTAMIGCNLKAIYDASTSGSTELVSLTSGQTIYICGYTLFAAGTVNVELDTGHGTACATSNAKITPAFQLTAQVGKVEPSPFYEGSKTVAGDALCLKASGGVAVQAEVYYTKF